MLLWCWMSAFAEPTALEAWAHRNAPPAPLHDLARGYASAAQHLQQIAERADEREAVVHVEAIGRTARGHPIWAFHVTEPGVPVQERVLLLGGIHALEWISVEVAMAVLTDLVRHPPRGVRVTVVPILNLDGRLAAEADLQAGRVEAYRRGNGASPPVDLNRDFAVHREATSVWRHVLPGYHRTSPTGALSQPESQAIDQLAARERFDRAASLHAFGGYFYFPWSGAWARPDDWRAFVRWGRAMESSQGRFAYRPRQLARWGFFFRAHGSEIDHLYGRYGTLAFLVELTRSGIRPGRFFRDRRTPFRWYNPRYPQRHVARGVAAIRALIRPSAAN